MLAQRTARGHPLLQQHIDIGADRGGAYLRDDGETLGTLDVDALWLQLTLSSAQVARLTGIPARKIRRWIKRGWLVSASRNPAQCSGQTVEQAILLDRALARGLQPEHAVHLVRSHQLRHLHRCAERSRARAEVDAQYSAQPQRWMAQEFAEMALRMLLLDLLEVEGAPKSPGAACAILQGRPRAASGGGREAEGGVSVAGDVHTAVPV